MANLHETRMGKTLIDSTIPKIAKELKRIADALELKNQVDALIRAKQEEIANALEVQHMDEYINKYETLKLRLNTLSDISKEKKCNMKAIDNKKGKNNGES